MKLRRVLIPALVALAIVGALTMAFFSGGPADLPVTAGTTDLAAEPEQTALPENTAETGEPAEQTEPPAEATQTEPLPVEPAPSEPARQEDAKAPETLMQEKPVEEPQTAEGNLRDRYDGQASADGHPEPVNPEDVAVSDETRTCTISISCDTILNNMDLLRQEKKDLVPAGGVILPATEATFYEGESVFHVLQRTCKQQGIHMEFSDTPIYHSAYIEGIANLYEFDCGNLSGWMYQVNGWFPNYGCSRYVLKDGDVIRWVYTCDLGRDVGGYELAG